MNGMTSNELAKAREEIDGLDEQIQALISQRARVAQNVALIKQRMGDKGDHYRPSREVEVLRRAMERNQGPLTDEAIARLMREAHGSGVKFAIVTNASLKTLEPVLKYTIGPELAAEVAVIASGEEVSRKKPAPDLYQLAMQRLGIAPGECVALEDSEMGLEAAAAAGVQAVVTINSDTATQDFTEAALVVSSLGEPGAPTQVLKGQLKDRGWVTLDTLKAICECSPSQAKAA